MIFDREEEKKDKEKNEKDDVRTMREVRTMVNTICDDIQMEETVASQCKDGKLPILDFQAWSEVETDREGKETTEIKWEFVEKEMVSRYVVKEDAALPSRMKTTVLAQEVLRRERNTAENVKKEGWAQFLVKVTKLIKT